MLDQPTATVPPNIIELSSAAGVIKLMSFQFHLHSQISPEYMMPWIVINSLMLLVDSVLWISEVMTGHCAVDLRAVVAMARLACTLLLVTTVRNAFEHAIKTNRVHSLRAASQASILRQPF